MRGIALVTMLTCTATLMACGGDGSKEGLQFSLDSSRMLETLSSTEVAAICSETNSYYQEVLDSEALCYAVAAFFSTVPQSCQKAYQLCIQQEFGVDYGFDCPISSPEKVKGCQATVEELSSCTNEVIQLTTQAAAQTCNGSPLPTSMPSCTELKKKCPQLL